MKAYIKMKKCNYKIWWYWNWKTKIPPTWKTYFSKNIVISEIVVSRKISLGKKGCKHFIGYKDTKKIRPLCIHLPKWVNIEENLMKLNSCVFFIKGDELLEKYNEIWEKLQSTLKKLIVNQYIYNEKYWKAKIKSYNGEINTNLHNIKIPKEGCHCICWRVILIDSDFRTGKNYYTQVFLEECKYVVKKKKDFEVYYWWHKSFFRYWYRKFWWRKF